MYSLDLTPAVQAEYEATLLTSHKIRTTVTVRDRNEDVVTALRPIMLSGEVQVDALADVTRSLSATFLDPANAMAFDPANPSGAGLYADSILEVTYGVYLPDAQEWVDVPVFWGPLTSFSRSGPEVTIEAQGKETLGIDPHLVINGYTLRKGTNVATAIRDVMGRLGEERFQLTAVTGQLPIDRAVIPGLAPWQVCSGGTEDAQGNDMPSLASYADGNPFLFYDGAGRLTSKKRKGNSVWTFDGEQLVSQPGFTYDSLSFRNTAVVVGTPENSQQMVRGVYSLPAVHPLSASSLGRNGKPRHMVIMEENEAFKTDAACVAKATALVNDNAKESADASFSCLPIPHLEELDMVTLDTGDYSVTFKAHTFTIPLTPDAPMTVGSGRFPARLPRYRRS